MNFNRFSEQKQKDVINLVKAKAESQTIIKPEPEPVVKPIKEADRIKELEATNKDLTDKLAEFTKEAEAPKIWSEENIGYLKDNFQKIGWDGLTKVLPFEKEEIKQKALELNLY